MKKSFIFLLLICFVSISNSFASHIVGYDMNMINIKDASGNPTHTYKFRLKFYRDINGIPIPNAFNFTIKANGSNTQVGTFTVSKINPQTFITVLADGCPPTGFNTSRIELGIYESSAINMSTYNNANGYYAFTELLARNPGIKNVQGSSDQYGIVMTMEFPALSLSSTTKYNSSPVINKLPPTFFCLQKEANILLNATDPDGDSLVFSKVQPLDDGATKPFNVIPYDTNYGLNVNILDGSPDFTINASNGNITFRPTMLGKYLIAFKCEEYRNSIKIGEIRRELQIEVVLCQENAPIVKDLVNNTFNLTRDTVVFTKDTIYNRTFNVFDECNDSLFLKVLPDSGSVNIFDTTQFKTNWYLNDTIPLPIRTNGLSIKGVKSYNLGLKWNIDSTVIKKTPYHFKLLVFDKAWPNPLSDTLDVELLIKGQCYQNINYNIIACDSLVDSSGRVFYENAILIDTVLSNMGCDKIISQYIIVNKSIALPIRGQSNVTDTNVNYIYMVDSIANVKYNWEVLNGQILSGKNTNSVEVKWHGTGSLICYTYYDSTCVRSTSFDVNSFVGVDYELNSAIKIYPNPSNNIINIEGLSSTENNTIQVFDVQGKLIFTKNITEKGVVDLTTLNNGIYVIKIGEIVRKIVKM